jgi:hypothetical protein
MMNKLLLSALLLGTATSAFAILQVDVDETLLPAGYTLDSAVLTVLYDSDGNFAPDTPLPIAATGVFNDPGLLILQFDGDAAVGATGSFVNLMVGLSITTCGVTGAIEGITGSYPMGVAFPAIATGVTGLDAACIDDVEAEEVASSFSLSNAYPNPFNPSTMIEFSLETTEMVSLNVYNINGQLVSTLVNGMMDNGAHQVTFDASALSSGVYLYSIEAGSFSETKKMILTK